MKTHLFKHCLTALAAAAALMCGIVTTQAADKKPNILVIFGDDVGIANVSAYSQGLMGYETPNIDRIGKEGIKFPGLLRRAKLHPPDARPFSPASMVSAPGSPRSVSPVPPMGMSQLDPSIGGLLKNLGYATGQFGKNHVGDRNPSLPR